MGFHKTLFLLAFLLSQNLLLLPLTSASNCGVDNAKNLGGPKGLSSSLCHHHSHHGKSPPSHGGGGCGCSPTPSHGGGSHHHDPSSPPYTPTPSSPTPYTPSPIVPSPPYAPYTPTPSIPSSPPGCTTPTTDPSSPPTPSGGYYGSPPPIVDIPPPTPTITPITPITPILPSPPVPLDPGSGGAPFPCSFWGSHPGMIFGVLGWFGTVGGIFGMPSLPGFGTMDPSSMSLQKILSTPTPSSSPSSSSSGYGSLYREASASFLNSLAAPTKFPYTTSDVRQAFASALVSDKAAADQARLFRLANEGHLKLV